LAECVDSTFVSSLGKFVELFEENIAKYTGAKTIFIGVDKKTMGLSPDKLELF